MTILVAGTIRVPVENLERFKPHMTAMLAASRAEDGCIEYCYAHDVAEPGLIRIFEAWRDAAALEAHGKAPHLFEWRASWPEFGVSDRRVFAYETPSARQI